MSFPINATGTVLAWMGVGVTYPSEVTAWGQENDAEYRSCDVMTLFFRLTLSIGREMFISVKLAPPS